MEMARTTADRWQTLLKRDAVSRQETDEKVSDHNAKRAIVELRDGRVVQVIAADVQVPWREYVADSPERLAEIAGDVTPEDFPL